MNSSSRRDINSRMVNLGKRQQEFREIMDMIANLFLRAKHWHIFLLLVGVGFIGDVALVAGSMSAPAQSPEDFGKLGLSFGNCDGAIHVLLSWMVLVDGVIS